MRIDSLYDNFNSLNNTFQNGFVRPVADFIPAVHEASLEFFNILAGQETKTEQVQSVLIPFAKSASIAVEKLGREYIAKYPVDYKYYRAGAIISLDGKTFADKDTDVFKGACLLSEEEKIDFLPSEEDYQRFPLVKVFPNQWNGIMRHPNRKPDLDHQRAYIVQRDKERGFEVAPNQVGVIIVDYYRLPVAPKYNYDEVENYPDSKIVFKENGSQHLEWGDEMIPAFLYRLSKRYGYTTSDELKLQVTNIDKALL